VVWVGGISVVARMGVFGIVLVFGGWEFESWVVGYR